ncbi:hypothetical protein KIPB_001712, partial [Kipferlia bialata]
NSSSGSNGSILIGGSGATVTDVESVDIGQNSSMVLLGTAAIETYVRGTLNVVTTVNTPLVESKTTALTVTAMTTMPVTIGNTGNSASEPSVQLIGELIQFGDADRVVELSRPTSTGAGLATVIAGQDGSVLDNGGSLTLVAGAGGVSDPTSVGGDLLLHGGYGVQADGAVNIGSAANTHLSVVPSTDKVIVRDVDTLVTDTIASHSGDALTIGSGDGTAGVLIGTVGDSVTLSASGSAVTVSGTLSVVEDAVFTTDVDIQGTTLTVGDAPGDADFYIQLPNVPGTGTAAGDLHLLPGVTGAGTGDVNIGLSGGGVNIDTLSYFADDLQLDKNVHTISHGVAADASSVLNIVGATGASNGGDVVVTSGAGPTSGDLYLSIGSNTGSPGSVYLGAQASATVVTSPAELQSTLEVEDEITLGNASNRSLITGYHTTSSVGVNNFVIASQYSHTHAGDLYLGTSTSGDGQVDSTVYLASATGHTEVLNDLTIDGTDMFLGSGAGFDITSIGGELSVLGADCTSGTCSGVTIMGGASSGGGVTSGSVTIDAGATTGGSVGTVDIGLASTQVNLGTTYATGVRVSSTVEVPQVQSPSDLVVTTTGDNSVVIGNQAATVPVHLRGTNVEVGEDATAYTLQRVASTTAVCGAFDILGQASTTAASTGGTVLVAGGDAVSVGGSVRVRGGSGTTDGDIHIGDSSTETVYIGATSHTVEIASDVVVSSIIKASTSSHLVLDTLSATEEVQIGIAANAVRLGYSILSDSVDVFGHIYLTDTSDMLIAAEPISSGAGSGLTLSGQDTTDTGVAGGDLTLEGGSAVSGTLGGNVYVSGGSGGTTDGNVVVSGNTITLAASDALIITSANPMAVTGDLTVSSSISTPYILGTSGVDIARFDGFGDLTLGGDALNLNLAGATLTVGADDAAYSYERPVSTSSGFATELHGQDGASDSNGGVLRLLGGDAGTDTGSTPVGGSVFIDGGYSTATTGSVMVGTTTNSADVTIGRSGATAYIPSDLEVSTVTSASGSTLTLDSDTQVDISNASVAIHTKGALTAEKDITLASTATSILFDNANPTIAGANTSTAGTLTIQGAGLSGTASGVLVKGGTSGTAVGGPVTIEGGSGSTAGGGVTISGGTGTATGSVTITGNDLDIQSPTVIQSTLEVTSSIDCATLLTSTGTLLAESAGVLRVGDSSVSVTINDDNLTLGLDSSAFSLIRPTVTGSATATSLLGQAGTTAGGHVYVTGGDGSTAGNLVLDSGSGSTGSVEIGGSNAATVSIGGGATRTELLSTVYTDLITSDSTLTVTSTTGLTMGTAGVAVSIEGTLEIPATPTITSSTLYLSPTADSTITAADVAGTGFDMTIRAMGSSGANTGGNLILNSGTSSTGASGNVVIDAALGGGSQGAVVIGSSGTSLSVEAPSTFIENVDVQAILSSNAVHSNYLVNAAGTHDMVSDQGTAVHVGDALYSNVQINTNEMSLGVNSADFTISRPSVAGTSYSTTLQGMEATGGNTGGNLYLLSGVGSTGGHIYMSAGSSGGHVNIGTINSTGYVRITPPTEIDGTLKVSRLISDVTLGETNGVSSVTTVKGELVVGADVVFTRDADISIAPESVTTQRTLSLTAHPTTGGADGGHLVLMSGSSSGGAAGDVQIDTHGTFTTDTAQVRIGPSNASHVTITPDTTISTTLSVPSIINSGTLLLQTSALQVTAPTTTFGVGLQLTPATSTLSVPDLGTDTDMTIAGQTRGSNTLGGSVYINAGDGTTTNGEVIVGAANTATFRVASTTTMEDELFVDTITSYSGDVSIDGNGNKVVLAGSRVDLGTDTYFDDLYSLTDGISTSIRASSGDLTIVATNDLSLGSTGGTTTFTATTVSMDHDLDVTGDLDVGGNIDVDSIVSTGGLLLDNVDTISNSSGNIALTASSSSIDFTASGGINMVSPLNTSASLNLGGGMACDAAVCTVHGLGTNKLEIYDTAVLAGPATSPLVISGGTGQTVKLTEVLAVEHAGGDIALNSSTVTVSTALVVDTIQPSATGITIAGGAGPISLTTYSYLALGSGSKLYDSQLVATTAYTINTSNNRLTLNSGSADIWVDTANLVAAEDMTLKADGTHTIDIESVQSITGEASVDLTISAASGQDLDLSNVGEITARGSNDITVTLSTGKLVVTSGTIQTRSISADGANTLTLSASSNISLSATTVSVSGSLDVATVQNTGTLSLVSTGTVSLSGDVEVVPASGSTANILPSSGNNLVLKAPSNSLSLEDVTTVAGSGVTVNGSVSALITSAGTTDVYAGGALTIEGGTVSLEYLGGGNISIQNFGVFTANTLTIDADTTITGGSTKDITIVAQNVINTASTLFEVTTPTVSFVTGAQTADFTSTGLTFDSSATITTDASSGSDLTVSADGAVYVHNLSYLYGPTQTAWIQFDTAEVKIEQLSVVNVPLNGLDFTGTGIVQTFNPVEHRDTTTLYDTFTVSTNSLSTFNGLITANEYVTMNDGMTVSLSSSTSYFLSDLEIGTAASTTIKGGLTVDTNAAVFASTSDVTIHSDLIVSASGTSTFNSNLTATTGVLIQNSTASRGYGLRVEHQITQLAAGLTVTGALTTIEAGLKVITADVDINTNVDIAGTLTVHSATAINAAVTIASTLQVTGANLTTLQGGLTVNNTQIHTTAGLQVSGANLVLFDNTANTQFSGSNVIIDSPHTLTVGGATILQSTLDVTGTTTCAAINAVGNVDINGNFDVSGTVIFQNTLTVTLGTLLNSTLGVTGLTTLGNGLNVTGTTAVTGVATISSTLTVGGLGTFNAGLTVNTTVLTASAGLTVTGATQLNNALTVTGAVDFNGGANISGTGGLVVSGNGLHVTSSAASDIGGNLTVTGILEVTSNADLNGGMTISKASGTVMTVAAANSSTNGINISTGMFTVAGLATMDGAAAVNGSSAGKALAIAASAGSDWGVYISSGKLYVNGATDIDGGANIASGLVASGGTTLTGGLDVTGTTDFNTHFTATSSAFSSYVNVSGAVDIDGGLTVDKASGTALTVAAVNSSTTAIHITAGKLLVAGASTLSGGLTVTNGIAVTGTTTFNSLVDITAGLDVDGTATMVGGLVLTTVATPLTVTGSSASSNAINITKGGLKVADGDTYLVDDLRVDGTVDFNSTLDVSGSATMTGGLTLTSVTTPLTVTGSSSGSYALKVTSGGLQVQNAVDFNNALNVDGATTLNTLTVSSNLFFAGVLALFQFFYEKGIHFYW